MITNPDYREDPWRESIAQALDVFDAVFVVCGRREDVAQVYEAFPTDRGDRLRAEFLDWPQPEWSYEELPRHLNFGIERVLAELDPTWIFKFDIDVAVHEHDRDRLRWELLRLFNARKALATFEKLQFFQVRRAYEKGKIPLALNVALYPQMRYGHDSTRYTDLCQPIIPSGEVSTMNPTGHPIPKGLPVEGFKVASTGLRIWNYDYSFKTKERATELLFHFDRSHALFWSAGYGGKKLEEITPETALGEYLELVRGRAKKCLKRFEPAEHPHHFRRIVAEIRPEQFGHSLWNEIELPPL